jgi:alcohol dehydrogenase
VHDAVDGFRTAVGATGGLRAAGIGPGHVDAVLAAVSGNLDNDPIADIGPELVRTVLEESL